MVSKSTVTISEEYAESIVNTVREPLIVLDQDLRVITASRSFYEFFKVKPEETVGQLIYDLGDKQWDIPRLRELLETSLSQKANFDDYEVEHDFVGIGRRTMLLNARRIPSPPDKLKAILLAIEDITKYKRRDDSAYTLAAIVNASAEGIIGKDLQGHIVSWNKGAENIYGYTEQEMQGKNISLLAPPEYQEEIRSQLAKLRNGESLKNYETKRIRKDGVVIDISLTLSPITDTSGTMSGVSAIMHDITEQKKARQALSVSEYSESIINTVREPLIVLDQDLRVVTVSRSFYEFFKVKPEETVGQLIYDLGNKQWDIPKLRELLETILPQKATFDDYEVEHDFAGIGRRIMLLNARQIQRGLGKERTILLAIEDITERKEIEAGLEKTRKELEVIKKSADEASEFAESVINTVREPLISLDQDLRVVTVSRSFYEFFKVKPEETVGQLIYDLGNKQWDIPRLRELLETILPQKATFENYEVEHNFAGIGRRIMLLNARQIQRVWGKERTILLAIEDITARKEIEAGLEKTRKELEVIKKSADEAREYAESIINTVREPLIALDQDLRVVTANRSFYEFFKVKPEETVEQLIYDLGNKQWDIPRLRELLETILPQDNKFDDYEVEHVFSSIGHKVMLLNARRITQEEIGSQLILLAIEDVTEKMRLERELAERTRDAKKAQFEAETATMAKSDFLANMSHELRTPLNSIIGFSEVLEDQLLGSLNESQRENVMYIIKAGRHLLSLINDILDLSKVESGKMELEVENVSLREALDASLIMQREKAARHAIKLDIQIEPDHLIVIEADERKLKQILFNLLSNAVKFTPDGGQVQILLKEINGAQDIEIDIRDTGIGIKQEDLTKLFKEFSQLSSPYDKQFEGTGLGLALTKKLVELHGGRIWVESKFGKGSLFAFSIPVKQRRKKDA